MEELNHALEKHGLRPVDIQKDEWARAHYKKREYRTVEGNRATSERKGEAELVYEPVDRERYLKAGVERIKEAVQEYLARNGFPRLLLSIGTRTEEFEPNPIDWPALARGEKTARIVIWHRTRPE